MSPHHRTSAASAPRRIGRVGGGWSRAAWAGALALTLSSLALALLPSPAHAWAKVGHRAASELAARQLTAVAASAVTDLLDPGERLADAALWADEHRHEVPGSGAWHYVNVPLSEPRYDARFCAATGCVVSKIADVRATLSSTTAPKVDKQHALRLLIHLVQDLHQPTHVGDRGDRGGNDLQVLFFGRPTNLHHVWDEDIIVRHSHEEATWLRELERLATPARSREWARGTVEEWASESLLAARAAYSGEGGAPLASGDKLASAYQTRELIVVRRRLAQAGVRLASILNDAFR